MEAKLRSLMDYQRFVKNKHLACLIDEAEKRFNEALSDDELSLVNAAGEINRGKVVKNNDGETDV